MIPALTAQRMNNVCKDELAGSEDSKSYFILNIISELELKLFTLFFYK